MYINKAYEQHIEAADEDTLKRELESLARSVDSDKEWKYRSEIKTKIRYVKAMLDSLLWES